MATKTSTEAVSTIGIDIGKNTFHLIGLDDGGAIILRRKLSRGQVEVQLANKAPCLIGMEACVGAHHLIPPSGMPDSRWGFPSGPISDSMW